MRLTFYGFTCDNPEFPSMKSSKLFTAGRILRDFVKAGFRFLQIYVLYRCKKQNWSY